VGGVEVVGQSDGVSTEVIQMAVVPALQVEIPTTSATGSTPDPSVGEDCLQADLDMGVREVARRLDPKATRILLEAMTAMWKVHQLREILSIASRVPDYSEKFVTQKRLSHV
jgi:hypothetical protein